MDLSSRQVTEWQEAQKKRIHPTQVSVHATPQYQVSWHPPAVGSYKLNVDASITEGHPVCRIGMILRDDKGGFVAGMLKSLGGIHTVLEAEAVGMHEALAWIVGFTETQVEVESDSLNVVNALQKNIGYHSEVGNIFDSCRSILRQRQDIQVQHVRRQANKAAHLLATLPCLLGTVNLFVCLLRLFCWRL